MSQSNIATLGGGCFWCVEAVYQRVEGVIQVKPGYAGGHIKNPTYKEICTGNTGHAEVAQLTFDNKIITYEQILNVFWQAHDPTTLNRQGNDKGTQYRSVVFFHSEEQMKIVESSLKQQSKNWKNPIVTQIISAEKFYRAEEYHQNYLNKNNLGSCRI